MIFILSLYIVQKNSFFMIRYIFKDISNRFLVQYYKVILYSFIYQKTAKDR